MKLSYKINNYSFLITLAGILLFSFLFTAKAEAVSLSAANLTQFESDGATAIVTGAYTSNTTLVFKGDIADADGATVTNYIWMEVEIEPVGTVFNGVNDSVTCIASDLVEVADALAVNVNVTCNGGLLNNTNYHWQAIVYDLIDGVVTATASYGGNPENQNDLVIDSQVPTVNLLTPLNGGDLISGNNITVDFLSPEYLDCATVTLSTVSIIRNSNSNVVSLAAAPTCSNEQIIINPDENDPDFIRYEAYTVTLQGTTGGIADQAGTLMNGGANYSFGFNLQENAINPNAPANLGQFKSDGTTAIALDGYTNEGTVVFKADISDGNTLDYIWMDIEVEPVGVAFNGVNDNVTCLSSDIVEYTGIPITATVTCNAGFVNGTAYHWQAIVSHLDNLNTGVASYGGNLDPDDSDLTVDTVAPSVSTTLPTSGSDLVSGGDITVNFTSPESIDCATVTISTVTITRNSNLNAVSLNGATPFTSCSAEQIVINVDETDIDLVRFETYTVTLQGTSGGVTDQAGNLLNSGVDETFTFNYNEPALDPNAPINLGQFKADGITPIGLGSFTNEGTVVFKADISDGNTLDYIWMDVEIEPVGVVFNGTNEVVTCIASDMVEYSGTPITATVTCNLGFVSGTSYHWQAIVSHLDDLNTVVGVYGGNLDPDGVDLTPDYDAPTVSLAPATSSTAFGGFVDGTFNLATTFADAISGLGVGCEYCLSTDGICDDAPGTEWFAGAWNGSICEGTGLTCTDGTSITLTMRASDVAGNSTTATIIAPAPVCDTIAPTTTDNAASTWSATDIAVTLTPLDGTGSGVGSTDWCVDNDGLTCTPNLNGNNFGSSTTATVACLVDTVCAAQYVRYTSTDNVTNAETINTSFVLKVDKEKPLVGTTFASLGVDGQCDIDFGASAGDGLGSGLHATPYKVVRIASPSDPATDCSDGTIALNWTASTYTAGVPFADTGVTNGETWRYRLCYQDAVGNIQTFGTVQECKPSAVSTVGDGVFPANKFAGPDGNLVAVSTFTLTTSSAADTLTAIDITRGGTVGAYADIAGVYIYEDANADNEYTAGTDVTLIGGPVAFNVSDVAAFTSLSGGFDNLGKTYLIVLDVGAGAVTSNTHSASVTAFTVSNLNKYNNDTTDATVTIDATKPTTTDDVNANWVNIDQTVTLTPADTGGSGLAITEYCFDTLDTCNPVGATAYSVPFSVTCGAGSSCSQYVRYLSTDNVGNAEVVNSVLSQIDKALPIDNALDHTVAPTNNSCNLAWGAATDADSGLVGGLATYRVSRATGTLGLLPVMPADCSSVYASVAMGTLSYSDTALTADNNNTYAYRLCAVDYAGNVSVGKAATTNCTPGDITVPVLSVDTAMDATTYSATTNYVAGASGFNYSAKFTDAESAVSCDYTINGSTWIAGTITSEGAGVYLCESTGATCLSGGEALTLQFRAYSGGGTLGPVMSTQIIDKICDNTTPASSISGIPGSWVGTSPVDLTLAVGVDTYSTYAFGTENSTVKYCYSATDDCLPDTVATGGTTASVTCTAGNICDYFVRYQSSDKAGNIELVNSTSPSKVQIDMQSPTDGTISLTAQTVTSCELTWTASSDGAGVGLDANGYILARTGPSASIPADPTCTGDQYIVGLSIVNSPRDDAGLTTGQNYKYRICSLDTLGNLSVGSNVVGCAPTDVDLTAPGDIADLTEVLGRSTDRTLVLSWKAPNNDGYTTTTGAASTYEFRYMNAFDYPGTAATSFVWASAQPLAAEPVPFAGNGTALQYFYPYCEQNGTINTDCTATGASTKLMPNSQYYFAMTSSDAEDPPNVSGVSNVASGRTALTYGWNAVSIPYDISGEAATLAGIFSDDVSGPYVWTWNGGTSAWTQVSSTTAISTLVSGGDLANGAGFVIRAFNRNSVLDTATAENGAASVIVPLTIGWNLVGNPYYKEVAFDGGVNICDDAGCASSNPFKSHANVVGNTVYFGFEGNPGTFSDNEACGASCPAILRPWWGTWINIDVAGKFLEVIKP